MLHVSFLVSVSISESVSQPRLQMCPNCKMVGTEVQRYRRMKERFWQKSSNNDEKILEKISEQDLLEKETSKNVQQYFWQKQNVSPDRLSIFLIYSLADGFLFGHIHWVTGCLSFFAGCSTTKLNFHSGLQTPLGRSISQGSESAAGKLNKMKPNWGPCQRPSTALRNGQKLELT